MWSPEGEKIIAAPGRGDDLLLPAAMKILLTLRQSEEDGDVRSESRDARRVAAGRCSR
jgi:hypothetical protein